MICYCGKPVWEYDAETLTCKNGHHTPSGVVVAHIPDPLPPTSGGFTVTPWMVSALSGVGSSLVLFVLEHIF